MFGLTRGFSSFLIMFATRNMNVYFKKYNVSFLSCKQVSVLPLIQICLKILTRVYLLPEFAFCLMQCCLPKPWEAPGPSQAGRPTRAPHGTLVYIQTQIIIRNHFKKPWVRTCSRMLFEVCLFFFFFLPEHISPIYFWNLLDPPLTTFSASVFEILEASSLVVWHVSYSEAWWLPCLSQAQSFSVMCFLVLSFSKK